MRSVQIKVCGIVQGVNFRVSTRSKAKELAIRGFVRNEKDGTVYIEAEGEAEQIEKLIEWCHKGPERANVESVNVIDQKVGSAKEFSIER